MLIKIDYYTITKFSLQLVLLFFLVMAVWVILEYSQVTCKEECEYKTLLQAFMAIFSILGGGLISVMGILFIKDKKDKQDNTNFVLIQQSLSRSYLQQKKVLSILNCLKKEHCPSFDPIFTEHDLSEFDIFVDGLLQEDSEFVDNVMDHFKTKSLSCLPPIQFDDNSIDIKPILRERLEWCKIIFILCGKKDVGFWVKNRLKLYSQLKVGISTLPAAIYILYTSKDCHISKPEIELINCSEKQEILSECEELTSILKKLEISRLNMH